MGRASRVKKERRENPEVPHYEIVAGLASASGGSGNDQETEEDS
jgi:hypothetical protein